MNDLQKTLNNASISEGHLLLGSVATQILVKMGRVLKRDDPLYIGAYRNFYDFDRLENANVLKSLLEENHFKWEDIRIIIRMLKGNRLSTTHPYDENIKKEDIMKAITYCYPEAFPCG
jgi:allophanate hydrolase subunit 2